jgi:hypothetical protein
VAAILDTVALAPSPRRSNQWRARGSVQIVCAFVGETVHRTVFWSSSSPKRSAGTARRLIARLDRRPNLGFAIVLEPVAQQ